jgi:hypothetical protein
VAFQEGLRRAVSLDLRSPATLYIESFLHGMLPCPAPRFMLTYFAGIDNLSPK